MAKLSVNAMIGLWARSAVVYSVRSSSSEMGRGKGALASPLRLQRTTSTPTYVLSFAHVCASKTRGAAWGSGRTPWRRSHAALQTRGLRALPQRLLAVAVFCLSAAPGTSRFAAASRKSRAPSRPGAGPCTPG